MKQPVSTLAVLTLIGACAPSAMAMSIKDDQVSLKLKGNIQFRASVLNDASDNTGNDYDPLRGTAGEAEAARFDLRRARLGFEAKLGEWAANFTIRAEKNDQKVGDSKRNPELYYANISRTFKMGSLSHKIILGLQKSFNAESTQSSSTFLFPTDTYVDAYAEERGVGIGYMLKAPFMKLGLNLHNNKTGTKDADAGNASYGDTNGFWYSGRIEIAPGEQFMYAKRLNSYVGKEGTHIILGFDVQYDTANLSDDGAANSYEKQDLFVFGPDLLFHWNALTGKVEYRMGQLTTDTVDTTSGNTTSADQDTELFDIQAGYAFLMDGYVLEPAIGYSMADFDDKVDSTASYGSGPDNGASGSSINVGVNLYWDGHDNKTQIAYQNWKAESGDADANIIRIQHQLNF